jgi:UDP-2,3-diacylglucosamine hydrolase
MKSIIVSDAHIKFNETQEDAQRRSRFLSFLNSLKGNTDLLVLNGDIFDLWIEWKHVIIKEYFPLLTTLAELTSSGTRIVLTPGNHDFWFNGYLDSQIGIEVCRDSFIETIDGSRFFINHGDRYTKNDLRYQMFRTIIRNGFIKKIFTLFHPDFALDFGIKLSRSSRNRCIPARKRELMVKSLQKAALRLLKANDYDYVIFSHSHIPIICDSQDGTYANTGDWVAHSSYILFSDGKLALKEYK